MVWSKERHEKAQARCKAIKEADYIWPVVHASDGGRNWGSYPELEWDDESEEDFARYAREDFPDALTEIEHLQRVLEESQVQVTALRGAIKARDESRFEYAARQQGDPPHRTSVPLCPHCGRLEGSCYSDCPTKVFPKGEIV